MTRRDEYREYIGSAAWRQLSMIARLRSANRCELCGAYGDHVHHIKYPKRFKEDHVDNLIVVCEFHHSMLHGIRGEDMSGDLMVVEGVEVLLRKDEKWFDFKQIFARLYECGAGVAGDRNSAMTNMIERAAGAAWGVIFDRYKLVTAEKDFSGQMRNRLWINQPGAFQLAAKYDSQKTEQFQRWLFEDLIPGAASGGRGIAFASTGNPHADMALAIQAQAGQLSQAFLQLDEVRRAADIANQRVDVVEQATKNLVSRLDEMTGGDFYMTARLALLKVNVNPEQKYKGNQSNAMALGAYCANQARLSGVRSPKVQEGTFMVGQYPKTMLRDGLVALGLWSPQSKSH